MSVRGSGWCGNAVDSTYGVTTHNQAIGNTVTDSSLNGIHLYGGSSYTFVQANSVTQSGWNGTAVFDGCNYNCIDGNAVSDSVQWNLYSDTTGNHNVWRKNQYTTSNIG